MQHSLDSRLLLAFLALLPALQAQNVPRLSVDEAKDVTAEGIAFVEASSARCVYYEGEHFTLRVRFGFESDFAREHLIQLFRRKLDVPVQLQASWLDGTAEVHALADEPWRDDIPTRTVAVNGSVVEVLRLGDVERDGKRFLTLELERAFRAVKPVQLELAAPALRFAYASGFEDDAFRGRVPADRLDAYVTGEPLAVELRALPEEGRPPEFDGALGRFTISAEAEPRDLVFGAALRVRVRIEGEGNLEAIHAPRLDGGRGFEVHGVLVESAPGSRSFVYDLAPRSDGSPRVPAIAFSFFDPTEAAYRTVETRPIRVLVRPAASTGEEAARETPPKEGPAWSGGRTAALVAAVLIGLGILVLVRRRSRRNAAAGTRES